MIADTTIEKMVRRIVATFDPLQVILFGSCARGETREGSDVDLLVIMPNGTHTRRAAIEMLRELRDADAAKDVIVATPEILRRFGDMPGMIYQSAIREGKTLYERN